MIKSRYTDIKEYQECPRIKGYFIILEQPMYHPKNASNLYKVDKHGNVLWEAELRMPEDLYVGMFDIEDGYFIASTWSGVNCIIDLSTGRIISQELTK